MFRVSVRVKNQLYIIILCANLFSVRNFMLQHMQTTPDPSSFLWTPLRGAFSFHSLTSLNETSSEDVSSWKDVTDSYSLKGRITLRFRVCLGLGLA